MSSFIRLLEVGQGCQRKKNWTWEFRYVIDNYCCRTNYPQIQQFKNTSSTSLVVQWLRIHLPMQGTQIWSLVEEDSICHGAAKPAAATTEARGPYSLCCNKRHHSEKRAHLSYRVALGLCNWREPEQQWRPITAKNKQINEIKPISMSDLIQWRTSVKQCHARLAHLPSIQGSFLGEGPGPLLLLAVSSWCRGVPGP